MMNKERKQWRRWIKAFYLVRNTEKGKSTSYVPDDDTWWYHLQRLDEAYSKIRHFYSNSW